MIGIGDGTMARVLAIGDIHEPACHVGYLDFCVDLYKSWDCDTVVFLGDIIDHHNISFHAKELDTPDVNAEYELASMGVKKWNKAFPKAKVMIGNHDMRVYRLANTVSIPPQFIKDYSDVWNTPNWDWVPSTEIDGVFYYHGEGVSGMHTAFNAARGRMVSTVIGHHHSNGGVKWLCGPNGRIFGMDVGCGVDISNPAMSYGSKFLKKPVLSAGVVIDGIPYHEIMPCAKGEYYYKGNYE